jgi:hypothetical protein
MIDCRTAQFTLALIACVALGQSAIAQVDRTYPDQFEARRTQQLRNNEAGISAMPLLEGVRHVNQVIDVRVVNGHLVVRTTLPTTRSGGYERANVAELACPLLVRVVGGRRSAIGEPVAPAEFLLQLADYTRPGRTVSISLTQSGNLTQNGAALLTLLQTRETPAGTNIVQFTAQRHPGMAVPGGVQLVVNGTNARGEMPLSVFLVAPDWATFVRRYPKETSAYLRPVLAELGQDAVFAPDPAVALQVFQENAQPSPAQIDRVVRLLPDLSSADYHRRDRATAALRAIDEDALRVFLHTDRSGLSAEQNLRVEQVLVPMGLLPPAETKRLRQDPAFLLDCLYSADPATRAAAANMLRKVVKLDLSFDPEAAPEVRAAAIRELRAKVLASGRQ